MLLLAVIGRARARVALVTAGCFVIACGVFSCAWPTELPAGAQATAPPAIYARWWAAVENCSGHSGDFNAIRWYRVPGSGFRQAGQDLDGMYSRAGRYIALSEEHVDDGGMVRHEMLHALLNVTGHPRDEFLGACKDVVVCQWQCVVDGGQWHAPAPFTPVSVDSLVISSTVALQPAEADGQRWVALTVSVVNPFSTAVFAIPDGAWMAWGVQNGVVSASLAAQDSANLYLDAHQTRTWRYEMRVADSTGLYTISTGPHDIDGGFGQHWTPFAHLVVTR